ncbi:MAG TPA: histidine ammonia-lyase [Bacteroidetes bacterium]|nr:histidine ammonia-lyase [Bacteroidota bacterium]
MFRYGKDHLSAGLALQLARGTERGVIDEETRSRIAGSRQMVEKIAAGEKAVYGINTGFGPLCTTRISKEDTGLLQHNILKSHSVGVGQPIEKEIAKLMLVLKAHALSQGYSGVAVATVERILWHVEADVIPVVPCQGSVGASGDLAPLSHLFLPLIGLGKVYIDGKETDSRKALKMNGLEPIVLGAKEGLALINGTQFIAAYAVKVLEKLYNCLSQADIIAAMMIEGLLGSASPFLEILHKIRPYKGTRHVAHRMASLLRGSAINASHTECDRVQDPYSLRCIPQVHGASRNAWLHLKELLEVELNAVTDNPIIVDEDNAVSGGNFHGQPLALPLDYACLAAAEMGNISDRRTYLSLTGIAPDTPKLLMKDIGLNSAFMILQYTSAALASENKTLCFPASADSIPTSLGQEDHVSMGSISGRKALQVVTNLEKILAIELLCAAQAFDFHRPLTSGPVLEAVHRQVRQRVSHAQKDRVFAKDINEMVDLITNGAIRHTAEQTDRQYNTGLKSEFDQLFELL